MIYYLTALINGFFNSVNRMTNVRAGKLFGTANGALINYVEATVLSLLLMLVLKNGKELSWGYIVSVPWWVYLGSICGLLAQLLQIVGTLEHARFVNSHAGRQSGDVADARLRVLRNVQPAARDRDLPHSGRYGLGGKGENGRGADCS